MFLAVTLFPYRQNNETIKSLNLFFLQVLPKQLFKFLQVCTLLYGACMIYMIQIVNYYVLNNIFFTPIFTQVQSTTASIFQQDLETRQDDGKIRSTMVAIFVGLTCLMILSLCYVICKDNTSLLHKQVVERTSSIYNQRWYTGLVV